MSEAREDRGRRAEAALKEFLGPAFDVIDAEYAARLTEIASTTPWETGKIRNVAMALRISRELKAQIVSLVRDGEIARAELVRRRQIERIPEERRKILGITLPA